MQRAYRRKFQVCSTPILVASNSQQKARGWRILNPEKANAGPEERAVRVPYRHVWWVGSTVPASGDKRRGSEQYKHKPRFALTDRTKFSGDEWSPSHGNRKAASLCYDRNRRRFI